MKKIIQAAVCAFFLLNTVSFSSGQTDSDRQKMNEILIQRKKEFGSYYESIDKHSGIFGNKTKNDIRASNKILGGIVKMDNQLISILNRKLDFKSFQTVSYDYDKASYENKIENLTQANAALTQRINASDKTIALLQADLTSARRFNYLWSFILLLLLFFRVRKYFFKKKKS